MIPMFLAHTSDVSLGFKKPLMQFQKKFVLANQNNVFSLISNVCPHQGSLILSTQKKSLTCQYHAWSWDETGSPRGSGTAHICNRSILEKIPTTITNNLIFNNVELPVLPVDLEHLSLVEERIDIVNAKSKNIMDLFLDVDHIPVVHPKLYDNIGVAQTSSVKWDYFSWGSIQTVYKDCNYSDEFLSTLRHTDEESLAAIWIAVYPYTMIEWQPGALFVTIAVPERSQSRVTVLKYRDTRYNDENWNINNEIWEEAWRQDVAQAECIIEDNIPCSNYEESKKHFHLFLKEHQWLTE